MATLGSKRRQCVVCGVNLERTQGMVGRDSKYCRKCYQPKTKSARDTNAPQVAKNSQWLCRAWSRR